MDQRADVPRTNPYLPPDVRDDLRRQRLELLRQESEHATQTQAILADLERRPISAALAEEARRSAELGRRALQLGLRDTARVGGTLEDLAEASGLSHDEIRRLLEDDAGALGSAADGDAT
jgi:hypothetical protein